MKFARLTLLMVTGASLLNAADFGLNETTATVALLAKANAPVYTQTSKTVAWLNLPLGTFTLRAEGVADVSVTAANGLSKLSDLVPSDLRLDVGTLGLSGFFPLGNPEAPAGVVDFSLGRRSVSDLSGGWVLGGKLDGLSVSYLSGRLKVGLEADYTGLVLKKNSRVSIGAADARDGTDAAVLFAPQRLVGALQFGLNELALRQDLRAEVLGQFDLRATTAVHSGYATVLASGPLPLGFRHSTAFTGGMVLSDLPTAFGALAFTKWTANTPLGKLALDAAWAQGLAGAANWVPIAGKGLADVTSLTAGNGARAGADFSFSPAKRVSVGVKGDALFRANLAQPAGLAGFATGNAERWLGAEATFYGSWKTSSELSLGWNTGVFFPNSAAVTAATIPTYLAVLTATLEL